MGWDNVSELRPPMGLLFVPRWYEYGEPWWNDTDRVKQKNFRKTNVPAPLRPPWISHGLTRAQTRFSMVRGWRLSAWTTTRPVSCVNMIAQRSFLSVVCYIIHSSQVNRKQLTAGNKGNALVFRAGFITYHCIIALMMEAARTSETSVDIQLRTRQYIPEHSELYCIMV
jgi:hypothetical protein